jgi:hypothetical protein
VRASRSRVGGHQGCSLTTSWLQRSGERHPVIVGSSGWASQGAWSGGNGGDEPAAASHNLDRREAVSVGSTGAPVTNRGFTFSTRNYSRPARVGIAPIKGILGREVVSSNRRAVDRSWRVR